MQKGRRKSGRGIQLAMYIQLSSALQNSYVHVPLCRFLHVQTDSTFASYAQLLPIPSLYYVMHPFQLDPLLNPSFLAVGHTCSPLLAIL